MFKKNKGFRLDEILSNKSFQQTLENLDWIHSESQGSVDGVGHAWEVVKIREIEEKSIFLAIMLRSLTRTFKFGSYTYTKRGVDLLERTSPLIKKKHPVNKLFKITKEVIPQQPKEDPNKERGVIIN